MADSIASGSSAYASTPQSGVEESEGSEKSKNQLKNEAKRAAKLEKLASKQAKQASVAENSSRKIKEIKSVGDDIPEDNTPAGEKKDTSGPLPSGYHPRYVESAWYAWWEKSGFFKPEYFSDHESREKFVIIIPPPNVTGSLHIGHAMMGSIEDAIVRWHRMCGKSVLYLPGTDHAGIATQVVVEKMLKKEEDKTRHDLGREKFVEKVWEWKQKYGHRIYDQMRRLGSSLDWDRARFTMDAGLNKSVTEAFIRLYDQGLIFRDNRLVNWCGKLKTAISDLEVESKEIDVPTMLPAFGHPPNSTYPFGKIWAFAYPLEDGSGEIIIETTRPETVFADSALAVNPNDTRYRNLIGKRVIHPITDRPLTIIGDEVADPQFGTGALKVSPAHDPIDFAVGKKHKLDFIVILDADNRLLKETCGEEFGGLPRYEARLKVLEKAQAKGLFRGEKPHKLVVPVCARSGDFVEPRMMPQWWLSCGDMARKSLEASETGELKIYPEAEKAKWRHWLTEIRDWCLSRQLWWGHRVPMYRIKVNGRNPQNDELWVPGRDEQEATQRAIKLLNLPSDCDLSLEQDHDVLDTWFSAGLWPFSTMGWPDNTQDLAKYYPNSLLETGSDILFFWVARMVMMGIHLTGQIPFKNVFLHSIVRDAHGRKMSKSLGNVVDPVHVIEGCSLEILHQQLESGNLDPKEVKIAKEGQNRDFPQGIPECGTDALRFALCSYVSGQMRDVNMDISKVHSYRKFCNKIWNAVKFATVNLGEHFKPSLAMNSSDELSRADCWILKKLDEAVSYVNAEFACYNLMNVTNAIYHFWLDSLCDVYLEALKPTFAADEKHKLIARNVLYHCIDQGLRMIHPFMPYLSEELWQRLAHCDKEAPSLCVAAFPADPLSLFPSYNEAKAVEFEQIYEVVRNIRSTAVERGLPRGSTINLSISQEHAIMRSEEDVMASLVRTVGLLAISDFADGEQGEKYQVSTGLTATFIKKE